MQEQTLRMASQPATVRAAATLVTTPTVQEVVSLAETITTVPGVVTDHRAAVRSAQTTTLRLAVQEASAAVRAAAHRLLHLAVQAVEVQQVAVVTNQRLLQGIKSVI